jgi:hypothetical protein
MKHFPPPPVRVDPLDAFKLRSWARAYLWAAGEMELHEAVDGLQKAAETRRPGRAHRPGRSADHHGRCLLSIPRDMQMSTLGQVVTCEVCGCSPCASRSFCRACIEQDRTAARLRKPDHNLPPKWDTMSVIALWSHLNDPRRHPLPKSIIDTFEYLVKQREGDRLRAFLAERTPEERRTLKKLLDEK